MSDMWEYIEHLTQDALEEDAYYREKDREIEEQQAQRSVSTISDDGSCARCGRDCYFPGSLGGCFCT